MSLLVDLAPIFISGLVGVVSGFAGRHLKDYLQLRRSTMDSLRYEATGSGTIDVPAANDWSSLEQRLSALQRISPTLAILDGWAIVESTVSARASELIGPDFDPDQDPIKTLSLLTNIPNDLKAEVYQLRKMRNMVAHAKLRPGDPEVIKAAKGLLSLLERLGHRFPAKGEA
jgi:hypothetical protein